MGEYSDWKPQDDLGHSSDDDTGEAHNFIPSMPAGYPQGDYDGNVDKIGWEGYENWNRHRREWRERHHGFFGWLRSLFV